MTTPKSLEFLEQQRINITNQIATLGDLRCGSITSTSGRCGKPNCHCHQPKDPGHGPNLRLTFKINGKTVTESLPDQPATRKAEREIAEFRKLQDLHKELIEVNAQILPTAPVRTGCAFARGKKTAETIRQEVAREMGVSVENQDYTMRIDHLRRTDAHVKFLSLEPLLGPLRKLNLRAIDWVNRRRGIRTRREAYGLGMGP